MDETNTTGGNGEAVATSVGLAGGDVAVGHELDALVAKHITDAKPQIGYYASHDGGKTGWIFDDDARVIHNEIKRHKEMYPNGWTKGSQCCTSERYPAYSTDGTAMLALLERMNELGYTDIVGRTSGEPTPIVAKFFARLPDDAPKFQFADCFTASAATRPEAVCRAALKALKPEPANNPLKGNP